MKIKELIDSEDKLSRGAFARDKRGNPVGSLDKEAVCWCLYGAMRKCYGTRFDVLYLEVENKIVFAAEDCIMEDFNDVFNNLANFSDKADFELIKQVLERADV
jgi:hypothetical protein